MTADRNVGIDVVHIRQRDGSCVLSLNGQGHLPCAEHPNASEADRIQTGKAGVSDAETLAAEPGQSVLEPADRVKDPGTSSPPADHTVAEDGYQERDDCAEAVAEKGQCCDHGVQWHHESRGCGYHGFSTDRCPCALSGDEFVTEAVAAARAAAWDEGYAAADWRDQNSVEPSNPYGKATP